MIPRIQPYLEDWTREFERRFNDKVGGVKAYSTTRGREALYFALRILGIGHGDEVFVQIPTCQSVLLTIRKTGAIASTEFSTTTKAIVITHLFGIPRRLPISGLPIPVIEDCAQCFGGKIDDRSVGTIGDMSFFSFGFDKPMSADEGGMLVINHPRYLQPAEWIINQKLDQIRSLVGIRELEGIDSVNEIRNYNAEQYFKFLDREKYELPTVEKGVEPTFLRFPIINMTSVKTENITVLFRKYGYDIKGWGGIKNLLCLPVHPYIKQSDLENIISILNNINERDLHSGHKESRRVLAEDGKKNKTCDKKSERKSSDNRQCKLVQSVT